jgi:hypothetical protein
MMLPGSFGNGQGNLEAHSAIRAFVLFSSLPAFCN